MGYRKQAQGKRLDRSYLTAFDKRQKMKVFISSQKK